MTFLDFQKRFTKSIILLLVQLSLLVALSPYLLNQSLGLNQLASNIRPSPGAAGIGDSLYPGFGNGGYHAQKYILDLNVKDVATSNLDGLTTIEAKATQSLSSFNLDFIGFSINGITVNGKRATYSRDGQELTITPAVPINNGDSFTVQVNYTGSPTPITSVAAPTLTGWVNYGDGSFVLSQPDGAANYYPVNDHPLNKAAYTFRVTVPKPYEVAANGVLKQTIDNGNTRTYLFEARDPIASYLTTVNISQFNLLPFPPVDGIPIRNYFGEGISQELLQPFSLQPAMLDYFSKTLGPYPFEVYGSVVINTKTGTALETQTLSIFGVDELGNNPIYLGGLTYSTEEVVAHELAHQWFGNSVSLSDWKDIWLNESFATYSQGLWIEHSRGEKAFDRWVKNKYNTVADTLNTLVPPGKPPADDLFNSGVYDWGALGLHALRLEIGNNAFFKTLQTYYSRYKGGNVRPEDIIKVAEEVSGKKLNPFFNKWFYSKTLADIPQLGLFSAPTGDQILFGTATADALFGRDGNDMLYGKGLTHALFGGAGDDRLFGSQDAELLQGDDGNDTLYGNGGTDTLDGGAGNNLIYGGQQADIITAGAGDDTIYTNGGDDTINSGTGTDIIWLAGGAATITLTKGEGFNKIYNFQLGTTKLSFANPDQLTIIDSSEGAQIALYDDMLAVLIGQSASTIKRNLSQVFVP